MTAIRRRLVLVGLAAFAALAIRCTEEIFACRYEGNL